jgi:hypothetical protein
MNHQNSDSPPVTALQLNLPADHLALMRGIAAYEERSLEEWALAALYQVLGGSLDGASDYFEPSSARAGEIAKEVLHRGTEAAPAD